MDKNELDCLCQERIDEIIAGIDPNEQAKERFNKALNEALREAVRPLVRDAVEKIMKGLK